MGKFKQKINEQSIVQPSGFTGVIIDNSKIVIDKTYIEKGTSFVNAFNNSNVILKDCGSPEPIVDSNENIVSKTTSKLKTEFDKKTLPFWVHSKIARFDNLNTAINDKNGSLIYLEDVNEVDMNDEKYEKLRNFRTTIESKLSVDEDTNETIADVQYMLEQQIMRDNVLSNGLTYSTKDIDYTRTGKYCLSGVTSSIKAVWTLDNIRKTNLDSPRLNLNYVNREIFPYISNTNKEVKINPNRGGNEIYKVDSFGQEIEIPNLSSEMIADNTFKTVVDSRVNQPILKTDLNGNHIPVGLQSDSKGSYLNFKYKTKSDPTVGRYYFSGPYLNDKAYISYFKNDRTTNSQILQNDVENLNETRFYVKINFAGVDETFDLFELLNDSTLSSSNIESASGYLWNFYLDDKINKSSGRFYLDTFQKNTYIFNPDQKNETCHLYGFKFKNESIPTSSESPHLFFDESGNNITDLVLVSGKTQISETNDLEEKLKDFYLVSPDATNIPIEINGGSGIILMNEDDDVNSVLNSTFKDKFNFETSYSEISASITLSGLRSESTYSKSNYIDDSLASYGKDFNGYVNTKTYLDTVKKEHNAYLLLNSERINSYLDFKFGHADLYVSGFTYNFTYYKLSGAYNSETKEISPAVKNEAGQVTEPARYSYTYSFNFGDKKHDLTNKTMTFGQPTAPTNVNKNMQFKGDSLLIGNLSGSIKTYICSESKDNALVYSLLPETDKNLTKILYGSTELNASHKWKTTVKSFHKYDVWRYEEKKNWNPGHGSYTTTGAWEDDGDIIEPIETNMTISGSVGGLSGLINRYLTQVGPTILFNSKLSNLIYDNNGNQLDPRVSVSNNIKNLSGIVDEILSDSNYSSCPEEFRNFIESFSRAISREQDPHVIKTADADVEYREGTPFYFDESMTIIQRINKLATYLSGNWTVTDSGTSAPSLSSLVFVKTGGYKLSYNTLNYIKNKLDYFYHGFNFTSINKIKLFDTLINNHGFTNSFSFSPERLREYVLNEIKNKFSEKDSSINYEKDLIDITKKSIRNAIDLQRNTNTESIITSNFLHEYKKDEIEQLKQIGIESPNDLSGHFVENYVFTDNNYKNMSSSTSADFSQLDDIQFDKIDFQFYSTSDPYVIGNPDKNSNSYTQYLTAYVAVKYDDDITCFYNSTSDSLSGFDKDINETLKYSDKINYEISFGDNVFNNIITGTNTNELRENAENCKKYLQLKNDADNFKKVENTYYITGEVDCNGDQLFGFDINNNNISDYVEDCFNSPADINLSVLFNELSGIYRDKINNSYYVKSPFIESNGSIRSKFAPDKDLYVSTGQKLTTTILTENMVNKLLSGDLYFSYDSNGKFIINEESKISTLVETSDDLILYFDKDCKIPFEFDPDNRKLYDHAKNGQKIYRAKKFDDKNVSNGIVTKYNYEYLNEFQYKYETLKELADFNDWYNIDTYINYSNINSSEGLNYECVLQSDTISALRASRGVIYETALKENSFKDGCFEIAGDYPYYTNDIMGSVNDDRTLVFKSKCTDKKTNIVVGTNMNSVISGYQNNFASLFVNNKKFDTKNNYQGYKMFSFNFFIPKSGWGMFDEMMYQANPYYLTDIRNNGESSDIMVPSRSSFNSASYQTDADRFEGYFNVGYNIFNTRVVQEKNNYQAAQAATVNGGKDRNATSDFGFISDDFKNGQYPPIITCGEKHTIIVSGDRKKLYAAGANDYGQLGLGSTTKKQTTFACVMTAGTNEYIVGAWATSYSTFVLTRNDKISSSSISTDGNGEFKFYAAGYNAYYNFGIPSDHASKYGFYDITTSTPKVATYGVKSIAGYSTFTIMITGDGYLYSAGNNSYHVLGNNNRGNHYNGFKSVNEGGYDSVSTKNDWEKVQAGPHHCIAMDKTGYAWVWGYGGNYRIGYGDTKLYPTKIVNTNITNVIDIAAKGSTTFIITKQSATVNKLYACGHNACGMAGTGTTSSSLGITAISFPDSEVPEYVTCGLHTAYVITKNGFLYSAGYNSSKQLGHNTKTTYYKTFTKVDVNGNSSAQVKWHPPAELIYDVRNLKTFDAGYGDGARFFVGVTGPTEKFLYAFGYNGYGQLGTGSTFSVIDYDAQVRAEKDALAKTVKEYYGFDSYKKSRTSCSWSAIIKGQNRTLAGGGESKYQLTLTSSNESLRFTVDLVKSGDTHTSVYNLKGFAFTTKIDGTTHNVIIPNIEIYIKYTPSANKLFMSTFHKNDGNGEMLNFSGTMSNTNICNFNLMNSNLAVETFWDELSDNTKNDVDKIIRDHSNNKYLFSNLSPIKTKNEFGYPLAWISPGHIGFSTKSYFNTSDNFGIDKTDMYFNADKSFETENKTKGVYDIEPFVKPFDMSTNLFYYKGSVNQNDADSQLIKDSDEVVIINARKMYNKVPDGLQKPVDSNLDLNLNDLAYDEIVLTGFVPLDSNNSNDMFTEMFPYVDNKFEYQISTENKDSITVGSTTYKQCRYTDGLRSADQWKLFKLSEDITFTTTNDFNMKLGASIEKKTDNSSDANKLSIPCKLSVNFSGLYFKQRVRSGIEHDDVNDVSYLNRLFSTTFLNSINKSTITTRWGLTNAGVPSGYTANGGESSQAIGMQIPDTLLNNYSTTHMFGGTSYYNDFREVALVQNSVNKWKTETHESKYADLMVFSDYYPKTSVLFGTPYFNMDHTEVCWKEAFDSTSNGENKISVGKMQYLAEFVKVATDDRQISIFNNEVEKLKPYPTSEGNITNIVGFIKNSSSLSNKLTYQISGLLNDVSITGLRQFNINGDTNVTLGANTVNQNVFGIYFDGLLYEKEVYLTNTNAQFTYGGSNYVINSILTSNVKVEKNGKFSGIIDFEIKPVNSSSLTTIELHNVKLPIPKISKIGITYSDSILDSLDSNGYYTCDGNTWQKKVMFNSSSSLVDVSTKDLQTLFTLQSENEIQSTTNIVYDNDGKISGMMISLKVPGFRKYKTATSGFILENQFETTLSSTEMLTSYQGLKEFNLIGYDSAATVGSKITSGSLNFEYNRIVTEGLGEAVDSVGKIKYTYNPLGKDDFQLEVITKGKNKPFKKELYYVNLPVDNWYNMCIYNWVKEDNKSIDVTEKIGFILDKISYYDESTINNPRGNEIFNCVVTNDATIDGTDIYYTGNILDFRNAISNDPGRSLYRYNSKFDVSFDACSRTPWTSYYSNDPSNIIQSNDEITDLEYNERKGVDLWNIGESSFSDNADNYVSSFENKFATIKLFANDELCTELNLGLLDTLGNENCPVNLPSTYKRGSYRPYFINYAPYVGGSIAGNTDYASTKTPSLNQADASGTDNNRAMHWYLNQMVPRKIMLNDSEENYVLKYKDYKYHLNAVPGMKCKNVMFVNSPNLSNKAPDVKYYENYNDALNAVNEYIEFFNHPEHRLPPVTYKHHILSSDYASYIYNSCKKHVGVTNDYVETETKSLMYDYKNNPNIVAYVWGNSQVSRIESIKDDKLQDSKLYWTKSSADEYISEVGSLYNFKESQHMTNIVKIETGSINERQTVLMPVLTEPFEFEQRTATSGIVKVNDRIIATAALGYNSNGYPVNSVLQYNTNGYTNIDTTQTTYLYVAQDEGVNNCIFGSTEQKPVYVDAIQQNTQSLCEKFKFLPNPTISEGLTGEDVDKLLMKYFGGNILSDNANETISKLFNIGERPITGYINSHPNYFGCYYSVGQIKAHSVYSYKTNNVNTYTNKTSNGKYVTFIGNLLSFGGISDTSINKESLNVFYNEKEFENLVNESEGIEISKPLITMNCFTYDGTLLSKERFNNNFNSIGNLGESSETFNDLVDLLKNYGTLYDYRDDLEFDLEPSFGAIWMNNDSRASDYIEFRENITKDLGENINNRHAIFDEYFSTNVTGVKLKIKEENLQSAPIYIKISLLKASEGENGTKFVWVNDPILDINLLDNYENIFDYSTATDREIEKSFVVYPGKEDLLKHVFGIKFTIKQIVPQQNEFNKCVIDDCEIYTSNMLDKYGISYAIEDVFIRKADANCRNNYKMEVNEYVWTLPTNVAEWHTVYDVLSDDFNNEQSLIDTDSYMLISGSLENLSKPIESTVNDQLADGDRFSYMTTYYFTNTNESKKKVTEILSDNYLVNSNIKISWKYIDYVYISYSCYSPNSMELLDFYFGQKIFEAVKSKLLDNIDNLNSNSAFKDKYKFSGGIAKQKSDYLDTKKHTGAFTWSNTFTQENWVEYQNVYQEDFTNVKKYGTEVYQTNYYVNGRQYDTSKHTGSTVKLSDVTTSSGIYQTGTNILRTNQIQTSTSVLKNVKYSSVENWTKTFMPIAIKYKIN